MHKGIASDKDKIGHHWQGLEDMIECTQWSPQNKRLCDGCYASDGTLLRLSIAKIDGNLGPLGLSGPCNVSATEQPEVVMLSSETA